MKSTSTSLSDTIPLSDQLTTQRTASTSLSDTIPLADQLTIMKSASAKLSDTIPLSAQLSIIKSTSKSLSDVIPLADKLTIKKSTSTSLSDTIPLADQLTEKKSTSIHISDTIPLADQLTIQQSLTRSLSDTIPLSAQLSIIKSTSKSLSDVIPLADKLTIKKSTSTSLSDTIPLADQLTTMKSASAKLSDTIPLSAQLSIIKSTSKSLSDAIPLADKLTIKKSTSTSLSDTIPLADQLTTMKSASAKLSDTIPLSAQLSIIKSTSKSLSDVIPLADKLTIKKSTSTSLSDTIPLSDQLTEKKSTSIHISDTIPLADQLSIQQSLTRSLSDAIPLADKLTITKSTSASLVDSIPLSDKLSATTQKQATLSDSFAMTDAISYRLYRVAYLSDGIPLASPALSFGGGLIIEARDLNNVPIPGAIYTIYPNPSGASTPLVISDGNYVAPNGDYDSYSGTNNNGNVIVTKVPFGSYQINMTTIPTGYNVLGNSTIYTLHGTNFNGTTIFRMVPVGTVLANMTHTTITSAPDLNATTWNTWVYSFDGKVINGSTTKTIKSVSTLPDIQSAGINNTSGINKAIQNQASVVLSTSDTSAMSGTSIINYLKVPLYSVPQSNKVVSVLPSIISTGSSSSYQVISTPPLNATIPGQKIIIPVQQNAIPSTGGVKEIDAQSNSSSPQSNATNDWFVIKSVNTLPSTLPVLPKSDKAILYVNVDYQHAENNIGFDWSKPQNFAKPPQMTLQLPKNVPGVVVDSSGCPVSDVFLYDPSTGSWTTNAVTILSSTYNATTHACDVKVQAPHYSQFALGAPAVAAPSAPAAPAIGFAAGGAAGVGVGPSVAPSPGGAAVGPYLKIERISYDVCDKQVVTIQVGTGSNATDPSVIVRTSINGVVEAKLVPDQPYADQNVNATIRKLVYQATISPDEKSFEVVAIEAIGNNVFSVGKTVEVTGCSADLNLVQIEIAVPPTVVDLAAPRIFDFKFQVGNGTKQLATEPTTQFVNNEPLSVYAIIDTQTPISTADLRFTDIANTDSGTYHATAMNIVPLPISNSTYLISATIPSDLLHAPGMKYWIHVENNANKIADSDTATIGVKPDYPIDGKLELDVSQNRAAGTTARPAAYFTNNGQPVYGTISLVVDGNTVYTSPGQVFTKGQSAVGLEWQTQPTDSLVNHKIEAIANIYDKSFTVQANIITFSSILTESIAQPITISPINDNSSNAIATPQILYSSFNNEGNMRYKVTAPDGTCVIGPSDNCLVKDSTFGMPGQIKSIVVGDQVYRVRYSGTSDPLERFSITSVDPIVGTWKVEIDSQVDLTPQTQIMETVPLKITFRPVVLPFQSE